MRPNMVIAAALDPSPLSREQRAAVVDLARAELLTPRGLRTLSPRYLRYRGRFEGNPAGARRRLPPGHRLAVAARLLRRGVAAGQRRRTAAVKKRLRALLDGFEEHLGEHGVGHVSEVFDGDPPQRPGGCFAQAWSVAELLRAYALLDAEGYAMRVLMLGWEFPPHKSPAAWARRARGSFEGLSGTRQPR